jgi:hypothetical protein
MMGFKNLDLFGAKKRAKRAKRKVELEKYKQIKRDRKVEIMEVLLPPLVDDINEARAIGDDEKLNELRKYRQQLMAEYEEIRHIQ